MARKKKQVDESPPSEAMTEEAIDDPEDNNPELIRPTTAMHIRNFIGEGEIEGVPFEISSNIDGSPIIQFANAFPERQYVIPIKKFIQAAYELDVAVRSGTSKGCWVKKRPADIGQFWTATRDGLNAGLVGAAHDKCQEKHNLQWKGWWWSEPVEEPPPPPKDAWGEADT